MTIDNDLINDLINVLDDVLAHRPDRKDLLIELLSQGDWTDGFDQVVARACEKLRKS